MAFSDLMTTMNPNASTAESVRRLVPEYFERPVCSDEGADAAYQKFLSQSSEPDFAFAHWLEAEARRLTPGWA